MVKWFAFTIGMLGGIALMGQSVSEATASSGFSDVSLRHNHRSTKELTTEGFDPKLEPFYHGVASGDPTSGSVVLWTRVTPEAQQDTVIEVSWRVATDTGMVSIIQSGTFTTDTSRDYTVKIEVTGLQPDTYYYYEFSALGRNSLRGRTRTTPTGPVDHLRFAVMSCSNYEAGFFHAYRHVADRNDLDAVIHLGDYIYEYGTGGYGDSTRLVNSDETVGLEDYRARYSLYRLDPDLRRAHQQHPFITVWDDHESANDSWVGGAQNHQPDEGAWGMRKSVSKQAYFEWLPIRDQADTSIYRTVSYGDLVDLIMLDTRLEGRDEQILDVTNPDLYLPTRTILGGSQKAWLLSGLQQSTADWKIIGSQVIFSPFHIGFASKFSPAYNHDELESLFLDIWDGYPIERKEIVQAIENQHIEDVVFLSGDFHSSFAFEVADSVNNPDNYQPIAEYDPETSAGAVAVEFTTPSITSANFDENLSPSLATILENVMVEGLAPIVPRIPNPHMKYNDLDRHGYVLLDVKSDTVRSNWYYVTGLKEDSLDQYFGTSRYVLRGEHQLKGDGVESQPKPVTASPAPSEIRQYQETSGFSRSEMAMLAVYPNPADSRLYVHFALNLPTKLSLELIDLQGRVVTPSLTRRLEPGVYDMEIGVESLPAGTYLLRMFAGGVEETRLVGIR